MKSRDTDDKAQFGRPVNGRRIDQKQARMKIAARRYPDPAVAAPALGLLGSNNPKPSGVAPPGARQGFVVGRSELVFMNQTIGFISSRSGKMKQNTTP
jgi:hypothetical protein